MKIKTVCGLLETAVKMFPNYEVSKIGEHYLLLRDEEYERILIQENGSILYLDRNYYINPNEDGPH